MTEFTPQIAALKRELRERGEALFGPGIGWQARLSRAYGINDRRLRFYLAEPPARWETVPAWLLDSLRAGVMAKRGVSIFGPEPGSTSGEMRDEAAYRALAPALENLVQAGIDAGWHPAEVTAAALSYIVEVMIEGAGADVAKQTLMDAVRACEAAGRIMPARDRRSPQARG